LCSSRYKGFPSAACRSLVLVCCYHADCVGNRRATPEALDELHLRGIISDLASSRIHLASAPALPGESGVVLLRVEPHVGIAERRIECAWSLGSVCSNEKRRKGFNHLPGHCLVPAGRGFAGSIHLARIHYSAPSRGSSMRINCGRASVDLGCSLRLSECLTSLRESALHERYATSHLIMCPVLL